MTRVNTVAADAQTVNTAGRTLATLTEPADLPLPEALRRACEIAVESLHVERAGIWLFVNNDLALRCVNLFERSSRKHTKGACLSLRECPNFQRATASMSLLPCESARTDSRSAELAGAYFTPQGISSILYAPLIRDGRLLGLLCCEHVGAPRGWSDADRSLALGLADAIVERMKHAEGALKTAPPRPQYVVVQPPIPAPTRLANELKDLLAEIEVLARSAAKNGIPERFRRIATAAGRGNEILRKLFDSQPTAAEHDTVRGDTVDDDTDEHPVLPAAATAKT